MKRHGERRVTGKSVTFSITVTYESNEEELPNFLTGGRSLAQIFSELLQASDEVIRQQSVALLQDTPTASARMFATRKVKIFALGVPRQPQKIIYDMRKNLPYWRADTWQREGLRQKGLSAASNKT